MGLGGCFLFGLRNGGFVSSRCREDRVGGFSPPTPLGRTGGPAPIAKKLIFCSHDCFDTCRSGGQPMDFSLDPLILFGDSTLRGKKGAGRAEGEPWVCPLPGRSRKEERAEIFNFGAGCRARVGPAEGCWGREATNLHSIQRAFATIILLLLLFIPSVLSALEIPADDSRLHYSGYASMVPIEERLRTRYVRFDRMIPHYNNAQYDNPGVRIRFKTNAKSLRLRLRYNGLRGNKAPQNSIGLYYVDGKLPENGIFAPPEGRSRKGEGSGIEYLLKLPADGMMHEYEIVLPLADSVDVRGLSVNDKALFQEPSAYGARCVIYGDSVVRSFDATSIDNSFPFIFGRLKNWDVVNMGMENIALTPWHAEFLAKIPMDLLIVLIGTFDWQSGTPLPVFKNNISRFIEEFRKRKPDTRIVFVTPLYSAARARSGIDLNAYREAFHSVVAERKDPKIRVIDGPGLVANDASFFAPDRIGLNDVGARQFAENLAKEIR